jgi:TPR repeat protein
MPSTDEGMPLLGVGGGDPQKLRAQVSEARRIADPIERAVRLAFLGRGLLDCDDEASAERAIEVLHEAMELGSPHAAFELASLLIAEAETAEDLARAVPRVRRAADGGLAEARELLATMLPNASSYSGS